MNKNYLIFITNQVLQLDRTRIVNKNYKNENKFCYERNFVVVRIKVALAEIRRYGNRRFFFFAR